jgi:MerR HTH family regulatory protein
MNLNYTNVKIGAGRDDAFLSHAYHVCKSKKIQDMLNLFRTRTAYYDMDKEWKFYRVLSYWDSKGLIECERESANGWRKFNLIEALWVLVIQKLRILETSLETIQHIKSQFFEILDWDFPITLAEYYVLGAIFQEKPTFFVLPFALCDFYFYEDLQHALANARFDSCIIIHLNPLLNKLLPKEGVKSRFPFESAITWDQQEILDILRNEDFDQITFKKENGKLLRCDIQKRFAPDISEHTLKQGLQTVDITTHTVNGRTTARTRVIKNTIKGSNL